MSEGAIPGADVRLNRVCAGYKGRQVLHSISMNIAGGEIAGIAGPNGSGKSTILRVIQGLIAPYSGSVSVGGVDMNPRTARRILRSVACVFQIMNADAKMPISATDVVMMGRYPHIGALGRITKSDHEIVRNAMELTGSLALAGRPYAHLSGGEQQRVNLARAIAQQPGVMLLDEPTTFLDEQSREAVIRIIGDINKSFGATIVIVSHDSELLGSICTVSFDIRQGEICAMEAALCLS